MDFARFAEDLLDDRQDDENAEPGCWVVLANEPAPERLGKKVALEYLKEFQNPPAMNIAAWQSAGTYILICIRPWTGEWTEQDVGQALEETPTEALPVNFGTWTCSVEEHEDEGALLVSTTVVPDASGASDPETLVRSARELVALVDRAIGSLHHDPTTAS